MPGNRLVEGLAVCKSAEVEGGAPPIFVQICREVVVTTVLGSVTGESQIQCAVRVLSRKSSIFGSARCSSLRCFIRSGFIVPMLKVFIQCRLLCCWVFSSHHCEYTCPLLRRLPMQYLVKLCIASMVFGLEGNGRHGRLLTRCLIVFERSDCEETNCF